MPDEAGLDNELWRFALLFYARDGVEPACLTLQRSLGVDVDILLLAIFAQTERGILLDVDDLSTVDRLVRDWREEIVQALRQLRTSLKSGPDPAPAPRTDGLRDQIKAIELHAEQIELALLAEWLDRRPNWPAAATHNPDSVPARVARFFATGSRDAMQAADVAEALQVLDRAIRQTISKPQ
jgi:uncharacterized protein (TIGR02444 family)